MMMEEKVRSDEEGGRRAGEKNKFWLRNGCKLMFS